MYAINRLISLAILASTLISAAAIADNQTATLTPILPQDPLPFTISIDEAPFILPAGLHSGVFAVYKDKWLFLAGRTNGMHGFGSDPFPPSQQNKTAFVIDVTNQVVHSRSLLDPSSELTLEQIDILSVTSPQYFQNNNVLYISGGYGIDTETLQFNTKPVLTAIDIPDFIDWVINPDSSKSAASCIRHTTSSWMQVTGGYMSVLDNHLTGVLVFGQNFTGVYNPGTSGDYTNQVRCFQIVDTGKNLYVQKRKSEDPNPSYRRRDLNVVPIMKGNKQAFIALSGVFTETEGIWTVPVEIEGNGKTFMQDPTSDDAFKQGMNNYVSANVTLYSPSSKSNYVIQLGGITFEYFDGSGYSSDPEFPFTNQVTTVKRDKHGNYTQYFMDNQYPVILSTGSNPGNELLFGAGAFFIEARDVPQYPNWVLNLDEIKSPTVIGYIIGGIMSTVPNTSVASDSTSSPYIFQVTLVPR
jgi:hypothetical protein